MGGLFGKVWRTIDGGASWAEIPEAALAASMSDAVAVVDVEIADGGAVVWIVGGTGKCAHSEDGGATWSTVQAALPAGEGLAVTAAAIRGGSVWLVGGTPMAEPTDDGTGNTTPGSPAGNGFVLRSDDAGATFATVASGLAYALTDVSFVNPAEGWAAAATYAEGGAAVGYTDDGGATWDFAAPPDLPDEEVVGLAMGATGALAGCLGVRFFGREVGVALCTTRTFEFDGSNGLYLTTDGGATWAIQSGYKAAFPGQLMAASALVDTAFVDCHAGWVAGEGKVIARWDNDDAALDCEAGGAPGDDVPADVGGGGGARGDCGCAATGSPASAGGLLSRLL
jgi:photosystem II stability/assembly factor-like uncharacterized protein